MTDRALVASDYTVFSPVFTDGDEAAAACDDPPAVTVTSRVSGEVFGTYTGGEVDDVTGVYSASLAASGPTAALDILELTWVGVAGGRGQTLRQEVEVVGGFYESIPGLRTIATLANADTRPVAQLRKYRAEIEDIIESAAGRAFVPRCAIDTHTVGRGHVRLNHRVVGEILAVRIDGVTEDVDRYTVHDPVTRRFGPLSGALACGAVLEVAYTHGEPAPSTGLVEAVREYVRAKATIDSSNANRNPTSVTNLATQEVYRFGTADPRYGRWTGIEGVDERINQALINLGLVVAG